jgi:hypothetical protein
MRRGSTVQTAGLSSSAGFFPKNSAANLEPHPAFLGIAPVTLALIAANLKTVPAFLAASPAKLEAAAAFLAPPCRQSGNRSRASGSSSRELGTLPRRFGTFPREIGSSPRVFGNRRLSFVNCSRKAIYTFSTAAPSTLTNKPTTKY